MFNSCEEATRRASEVQEIYNQGYQLNSSQADEMQQAIDHARGFFLPKKEQKLLNEKLHSDGGQSSQHQNSNRNSSITNQPQQQPPLQSQFKLYRPQRLASGEIGNAHSSNDLNDLMSASQKSISRHGENQAQQVSNTQMQLRRRTSTYNMPDGSVRKVFFHNQQTTDLNSRTKRNFTKSMSGIVSVGKSQNFSKQQKINPALSKTFAEIQANQSNSNQDAQQSNQQTVSSANSRPPLASNRLNLDKSTPELIQKEKPALGEIISKNGITFKHQKPQDFKMPDEEDFGSKPTTAAQGEVDGLMRRVEGNNLDAKLRCAHSLKNRPLTAGQTVAPRTSNFGTPNNESNSGLLQRPNQTAKELESVITSQFSKFQQVQAQGNTPNETSYLVSLPGRDIFKKSQQRKIERPTFINTLPRQISEVSALSPVTATLAGQAEATIISRELNKQFRPQLEIKVNKNRIFSANPTKSWAADKITASHEDLLTQNLKKKIEQQQRQQKQMLFTSSRNAQSGAVTAVEDTGVTVSPPLTEQFLNAIGEQQSVVTGSQTAITTAQVSLTATAKQRQRPGYAKKLCVQIEEDMRKKQFNLQTMQEEMYGVESGKPTELNVVFDVHQDEADKQYAGIVAVLPQAKPQKTRQRSRTLLSGQTKTQRPKSGICDLRQQPSQRKKSETQKKLENVQPINLKGDPSDASDYAKFKFTLGQQIMTNQQFFPSWVGSPVEIQKAGSIQITHHRTTMQKATEGLYKRLKKAIVDVDEIERKMLTGGKVEKGKLERATIKTGFSKTPGGRVKHNTYTQMELQSNILNGNLTFAVSKAAGPRLSDTFYAHETHNLDLLEQEILRKAAQRKASRLAKGDHHETDEVQTSSNATHGNHATVLSKASGSQGSLTALQRRRQQRASSARFRISKQQQERNSTQVRGTVNFQQELEKQAAPAKPKSGILSHNGQALSNVQSAVNFATSKPAKLLQAHNHPSEAETALSLGTHAARIGQRANKGDVRPTTAGRPGGNAGPTRLDLTQGTLTVSGFQFPRDDQSTSAGAHHLQLDASKSATSGNYTLKKGATNPRLLSGNSRKL